MFMFYLQFAYKPVAPFIQDFHCTSSFSNSTFFLFKWNRFLFLLPLWPNPDPPVDSEISPQQYEMSHHNWHSQQKSHRRASSSSSLFVLLVHFADISRGWQFLAKLHQTLFFFLERTRYPNLILSFKMSIPLPQSPVGIAKGFCSRSLIPEDWIPQKILSQVQTNLVCEHSANPVWDSARLFLWYLQRPGGNTRGIFPSFCERRDKIVALVTFNKHFSCIYGSRPAHSFLFNLVMTHKDIPGSAAYIFWVFCVEKLHFSQIHKQ